MAEPAKGWAVAEDGVFDIRSVSPTRRAALVNWLHVNVVPIPAAARDDEIEAAWRAIKRVRKIEVFEVWISEGQ